MDIQPKEVNMAKLPSTTTEIKLNNITETSFPRPHLGASMIGHSCMRYLLYSFRWAFQETLNHKTTTIFRLGDAVEEIVVADLKKAGMLVSDSQLRITDETGHGGGSIDGLVKGVPEYPDETLLLEVKSMNQSNFLDLKKKQVKSAKPVYYSQMQMYMGRLKLSHSMFIAMNKNTSELYIEFVEFDPTHYELLKIKENEVLNAEHINEFPPISTNPSWFECKFCRARPQCFNNAAIEKNCRTCENSEIQEKGIWRCLISGKRLSVEEQIEGCDMWELGDMWR